MTYLVRVKLQRPHRDAGSALVTCTTSEPVLVGDYLPALVDGYGCALVTQRRHEAGVVVLVAEAWPIPEEPTR